MSQRWALLLQYDGTEFAGSQWQPDCPTVQGALQSALASLGGTSARVSMAGRTDAGVHALGQVGSFVSERSEAEMSGYRWMRGINHFLPASVAVQAATAVEDGFDPRRDAVSRTYRYELRVSRQRQPLWQGRAWTVSPPFRVELARSALSMLVGERDFAGFTPPTDDGSTVRTVRTMREAGVEWGRGLVVMRFRADSFLQHQVRRMVGSVVEVARSRMDLKDFARAVELAAPGSMGPTAPACGLTLMEVEYDRPLFASEACARS